ncbi:Serpentine Receptor, class J [Caenorhabditis elegans]|uniref:Serpentine Receptor, class J n=1 Tax=Caenorhabditis elegans TaxID=6239 RepID=Q966G6_CAEEL|nr:Serpentine Receptor, class J [Caenorhabditis elegans]CCD83342.1 Serpentine Receptor, class J [Caenorhabditis elegans]|eukprot:NP_504896.1 Serpentine Receptor, class J [Caenorhabditis elegans]
MLIRWAHRYLPAVAGYLSYVVNPVLAYFILTEPKNSSIGKYRFLILFFAVFDMVYSTVELFVPVGMHGTGSAFVIYLAHGPFFGKEHMRLAQLAISIRCGCISLSYGILVIHFIYRYIALFFPQFVKKVFQPLGMCCILIFFLIHGIVWGGICELFLYADDEMRDYIRDVFRETYEVDSYDIAFLAALYLDGSKEVKTRGWVGIGLLSCISVYAVSLYIILGRKIVAKLNTQNISQITRNMHKQLFMVLAVQTIIPVCISFSPCMMAWYGPMFYLDLGMWNNYFGVIAFSAFPFLDPLAIMFLLPNYRKRIIGSKTSKTPSCTVLQMGHVTPAAN